MILCDMDGVLATGRGADTTAGQPIYRTFMELPDEFERIRGAALPIHVVTAKVETEAAQVLRAIGLDSYVDSVVGANRLFWPTVWDAVRRGRLPQAVSKSLCRRLLPGGTAPVVMIENHRPHLIEMLAADAIDLGILVPPISLRDDRISTWFDLNLALRIARQYSLGTLDAAELSGLHIDVFRWSRAGAEQLDASEHPAVADWGRYLIHLPSLSVNSQPGPPPVLEAFDTGHVLVPGRAHMVTTARAGRRFIKGIVRRLR